MGDKGTSANTPNDSVTTEPEEVSIVQTKDEKRLKQITIDVAEKRPTKVIPGLSIVMIDVSEDPVETLWLLSKALEGYDASSVEIRTGNCPGRRDYTRLFCFIRDGK